MKAYDGFYNYENTSIIVIKAIHFPQVGECSAEWQPKCAIYPYYSKFSHTQPLYDPPETLPDYQTYWPTYLIYRNLKCLTEDNKCLYIYFVTFTASI